MLETKTLVARAAVALAVVAGPLGAALASPAQDLFDEATFELGFYYNGPGPNPGFRALRQQYQAQLDAACAADKVNCPASMAVPIVSNIAASFKDPFTFYVDAAAGLDQERLAAGRGPAAPRLGLVTRQVEGLGLVVVEVYQDEPGALGGLARGDVISTVNGLPATAKTLSAAEAGKDPVGLVFTRRGARQMVSLFSRVAEQGKLPSDTMLNGNVAYLRIPDFWMSNGVARTVHLLVRKALENKAKGFILDLRDSDTGLDTEALMAAAAFVARPGFVYKTRFQGGVVTYTAEDGQLYSQAQGEQRQLESDADSEVAAPQLTDLPLVVLVNGRTTNSAEMLAYFLQSAKRAQVVGQPTAGQLSVSGGANDLINEDYLNVSSLRLYDLGGTLFPTRVTPNAVVADDPRTLATGRDLPLERALQLLGAR